ncbi:hypothetical protein D9M68_773000 [compost metagenome]
MDDEWVIFGGLRSDRVVAVRIAVHDHDLDAIPWKKNRPKAIRAWSIFRHCDGCAHHFQTVLDVVVIGGAIQLPFDTQLRVGLPRLRNSDTAHLRTSTGRLILARRTDVRPASVHASRPSDAKAVDVVAGIVQAANTAGTDVLLCHPSRGLGRQISARVFRASRKDSKRAQQH